MKTKNHYRPTKFLLIAILALLAILILFWLAAATFFTSSCKDLLPKQNAVGAQKVTVLDKMIMITSIETHSRP